MRADVFLVDAGHASTRSQAQRLIAAGVRWRLAPLAAWNAVAKNGDDIPAGAEIELLDDSETRYVSRGGLKLAGALAASGIRVAGLRCLDLGQSTGGFTDCLLQAGAVQVIGVDVGQGQLHARLRQDARVIAIEGLNARQLTPAALQQACEAAIGERVGRDANDDSAAAAEPQAPYAWMRNGGVIDDDYDDSGDVKEHEIAAFEAGRAAQEAKQGAAPRQARARLAGRERGDTTAAFDLIVADLSFISLTLVLPALAPLLAPHGQLLLLVKPQFELQPGQVGKGGIVRDAALYAQVQARMNAACAQARLEVAGWHQSAISGGDGNREFFLHARSAP